MNLPPGDDLHHRESRAARARLRDFTRSLLRFDDLTQPLRFVLDPASGDPVAPIHPALLAAAEVILFIPDEEPDALQLLVEPVEIQPDREAAADRWLIYHGPPPSPRWARLVIQSGRRGREVFDADDLRGPDPLLHHEPRLLTRLNADLSALARACARATGSAPADPRAVGVDPGGLDIRARFGIIRIPFDPPALDVAAAEARLAALLAEAGA